MLEETQQARDYAAEIAGARTIRISGITNWQAVSLEMLESLASRAGMRVTKSGDTSVEFHGESGLEESQGQELVELLNGLAGINEGMQFTTA